MLNRYIIYLTALIFLTQCNLFSSDDDTDEDVLIPIAEANTWEYESTTDDIDAPVIEATGATRTIDGRVFDELFLTGWDEEASGDAGGFFLYVHQDEDGLYFSAEEGDVEEIDMFFRYPIEDGASYVHVNQYGSFSVTVSESSIIVPAGNFETIAYGAENDLGEDVIHFSPGIGPVAITVDEIVINQLISYDVR